MDYPGDRFPSDRTSPRRELQGPRPAPLKVSRDSHKIKKPPVAPPPRHLAEPAPPQYRPPVIIYTVSPKVIHATPGEFMSLVQRLTGAAGLSSSASAAGGVLSPAARLAAYETAATLSPGGGGMLNLRNGSDDQEAFQLKNYGGGGSSTLDDQPALAPTNSFPGILSPVPSSLPAISLNLFSPPANQNQINFFHELSSPAMDQNSLILASHSNILYTPVIPSPGSYWDLFNQYQDP